MIHTLLCAMLAAAMLKMPIATPNAKISNVNLSHQGLDAHPVIFRPVGVDIEEIDLEGTRFAEASFLLVVTGPSDQLNSIRGRVAARWNTGRWADIYYTSDTDGFTKKCEFVDGAFSLGMIAEEIVANIRPGREAASSSSIMYIRAEALFPSSALSSGYKGTIWIEPKRPSEQMPTNDKAISAFYSRHEVPRMSRDSMDALTSALRDVLK